MNSKIYRICSCPYTIEGEDKVPDMLVANTPYTMDDFTPQRFSVDELEDKPELQELYMELMRQRVQNEQVSVNHEIVPVILASDQRQSLNSLYPHMGWVEHGKPVSVYKCDKDFNLYVSDLHGDKNVWLSNSIPVIKSQIMLLKNQKFEEQLEIELMFSNFSKTGVVKIEDLISTKWMFGIENLLLEVSNHRDAALDIKRFLTSTKKRPLRKLVLNEIGWFNYGDNLPRYVTAETSFDKSTGFDEVKVESELSLKIDSKLSPEDCAEELLAMKMICSDISIPTFMYLYTHAGFLTSLFKEAGHPIRFFLYLNGPSNTFKSSLANVFFNVFNRETGVGDPPVTFNQLPASVEKPLNRYKDAVCLIDDYHPTESAQEAERMRKIFSKVSRMVGDGAVIKRMTNTMKEQESYPLLGVVAMTGEDLKGTDSSLKRMVSIDMKPGYVDTNQLSYFQKNFKAYPTHIHYFTEWVSTQYNDIKEYINNSFTSIRDKYSFTTPRMGEAMAIMELTANILAMYLHTIGIYNDQTITNFIEAEIQCIHRLISTYDSGFIHHDPAILTLSAIDNLLITNRCFVRHVDGSMKNEKGKFIGEEDNRYYYLIAEVTHGEIVQTYKRAGINYPISKNAMIKALDVSGVLKTTYEMKNGMKSPVRTMTHKFRTGNTRRVLVVDKEAMHAKVMMTE